MSESSEAEATSAMSGTADSTSSMDSSVSDGCFGGGESGGEDSDSDTGTENDTTAPSVETAEPATDAANQSGYSFSGAIDAGLADTMTSLSLSHDTAKADAQNASFSSMPDTLSDIAMDTAVGHFGMSALQGAMAAAATHSGKAGLSVGVTAATNPTSIASALSQVATKGLGMTSTTHNVGNTIGSTLGSAIGPVGAVVGGLLGSTVAELGLDAFNARDYEMAKDVLENEFGTIGGRLEAASMSELGLSGFTAGLNDPTMTDLDAYTAGAIGQAQVTANAAAVSSVDPTTGISVSPTSISGMDTSVTNTDMGISSAISSSISNANNALSAALSAPDRSAEFGYTNMTSPSAVAQNVSVNAFNGNSGFTPTGSYGWLSAGLPVSTPSSSYKSSYWDGTRFVNMNDYRGFI